MTEEAAARRVCILALNLYLPEHFQKAFWTHAFVSAELLYKIARVRKARSERALGDAYSGIVQENLLG